MSVRKPGVSDAPLLPSAPPLDSMPRIPGYEGANYDAVTARPPITHDDETLIGPTEDKKKTDNSLYPENIPNPGLSCQLENSLNRVATKFHVTEQEARELLSFYVRNQCCYGKKAARDMHITAIQYTGLFHYSLQTFSEKRQTSWAFEPYNGEPLDTSAHGRAPLAWDMEVAPPRLFHNHVLHTEVPHTASVQPCHQCAGSGKVTDPHCRGDGEVACLHCHGDGNKMGSIEPCVFCNGKGHEKCSHCGGSGYHGCRVCCGRGQLKCYIRLSVSWNNHIDDHLTEGESSRVPVKLLRRAQGALVLDDDRPKVGPINHFPEPTVNMASAQLVHRHASAFPNQRILRQRQTVRLIPVNEVHFWWKAHEGCFLVIGVDKEVFVPNYPQSCCWGLTPDCTLL